MPVDRVVCLETTTITQGPAGKDDLYRLFHEIWGYGDRFMGLRIGGMSVQLLGNKQEEDNSGRQKSGLGGEREWKEREGKTTGEIEEGERQ